jgi:hypothetical protein
VGAQRISSSAPLLPHKCGVPLASERRNYAAAKTVGARLSLVYVVVAFTLVVCLHLHAAPATPQFEIRGEPINSPAQTNRADEPAVQTNPQRKKYPKPGSFQKRMVQFYVNQAAGGKDAELARFGGNPAKIIFSPAGLAALPEASLPPGYQRLGFDTLSAFPFEVSRLMAEGSTDLAAASSATQATIPKTVQALDDHLAAIRGFLLPLKMNNGLAIEFLLMRNQNLCCFGAVPKINEWILVQAPGEGVKPVMDQPITVMGRLRVGEIREGGYLVGIYRMEAEKILEPESR